MSQGKLGPLASRALGQAGLDTAPKPQQTDDLAARLDAPLDDLVKSNRKKPKSLIDRARAKAKAKGPAKEKTQLASKTNKKIVSKDAKQAVRAHILAPQKAAKPKAPVVKNAPHLVPAGGRKISLKPKPVAHQNKGAAVHKKPAAASTLTISLSNIRQKKAAARTQLKAQHVGDANSPKRTIVAAGQAKVQRQQAAQARRVIAAPPPAAAAKGPKPQAPLTLSDRFGATRKPQQQQQKQQQAKRVVHGGGSAGGGGGRKVNRGHGGGGATFKVTL